MQVFIHCYRDTNNYPGATNGYYGDKDNPLADMAENKRDSSCQPPEKGERAAKNEFFVFSAKKKPPRVGCYEEIPYLCTRKKEIRLLSSTE